MTEGAKPYTMKVVRPVLNGGDEETGLVRPRLVATQLECAFFGYVPAFTHSALERAVLLMMPAVRYRLHMDPHGSNMHLSKTKSAG